MEPFNEDPVSGPNQAEPTVAGPNQAEAKPKIRQLITFGSALAANRWIRFAGLTFYYLGILLGLIWLYGKGDFSTPSFIYQGF
jgi:hypothetical protein